MTHQELLNLAKENFSTFTAKPKGKIKLLQAFGAIVTVRGKNGGMLIFGCWKSSKGRYGYVPLFGAGPTVSVGECEAFFARKWSRILAA
jgi:hypothetical protein